MPRMTFYDFLISCENCGMPIKPKERYCIICKRGRAWLKPKSMAEDEFYGTGD